MLYKLNKYCFLLIVVLLSNASFAQWSQHNGPRGKANILYADFEVVFSYIDSSRIYKTAYDSDNWVEAHNGIPGNTYIKDFIKAENQFIAAVSNNVDLKTVFISSDNGDNWTQSSLVLEFDPQYIAYIDSTIFVSTNSFDASPLHYSSDQGATWQESNSLSEANQVGSLIRHNNKIFASTNMGFFVSEDKGANWTKKTGTNLPTFSSFSIMLELEGGIIHGINSGFTGFSVHSTNDEGDTWALETVTGLPTDGEYQYTVPVKEYAGRRIYSIGTKDATNELPTVYKSIDYGVTWEAVGISPFFNTSNIAVNGSIFYLGTQGGILNSVDEGASWEEFSEGILYNGNTRGFASANGKLFTSINGKVHSITSYPGEWSPIDLPDSASYLNSILSINNKIFAYAYNMLFRSSDGGTNWDDLTGNFPSNFYSSVYGAGDAAIYIGGRQDVSQVLYYSTDDGNTWNNNTFPGTSMRNMAVVGSAVYVVSGNIFKTTDNGATWVEFAVTGLGDNPNVTAVTEFNGRTIIFDWSYSDAPQAYFRTDQGANWNACSGLGDDNIVNSYYVKDNFVFAATRNGIFISDDGETWSAKNEGFGSQKDVKVIYFTGKYYVASIINRAVWFIASPNLTDVENSSLVHPSSFKLNQNYPNPFNPSTTIKFSIPNSGFVTLKVFNILGEEVTELVNNYKNAGSYEAKFNAKGLTSGIYFYKLNVASGLSDNNKNSSNNFSEIKKMILIK